MSFDTIRPILSEIIGALVAGWLVTKWARWVTAGVGRKGRERLLEEHRRSIRVANVLSFSGLLVALVCYWGGWLSRHDWRGLGLGAGLMAFLPIAYITAACASRGTETIKECLVAYAIHQKTPTVLLFAVMALLIIGGVISAFSLFT
ncbi:MAG: hypothetical protein JNN07_24145 [Verrucomicrobiales bacterium]|nr:hypothetical protein [Verrucomicrobiales bacterium]